MSERHSGSAEEIPVFSTRHQGSVQRGAHPDYKGPLPSDSDEELLSRVGSAWRRQDGSELSPGTSSTGTSSGTTASCSSRLRKPEPAIRFLLDSWALPGRSSSAISLRTMGTSSSASTGMASIRPSRSGLTSPSSIGMILPARVASKLGAISAGLHAKVGGPDRRQLEPHGPLAEVGRCAQASCIGERVYDLRSSSKTDFVGSANVRTVAPSGQRALESHLHPS